MAPGDQLDLLDYPNTPGWQEAETSIEAAEVIAPELKRLQAMVLGAIQEAGDHGRTADEVAVRLDVTPFTARPRCTELRELKLIQDSGFRRENESGRRAIVWVAVNDTTTPQPRGKHD